MLLSFVRILKKMKLEALTNGKLSHKVLIFLHSQSEEGATIEAIFLKEFFCLHSRPPGNGSS